MRLVMEPVEVRVQNRQPAAFRWRRRIYPVDRVLETWSYRGRWWLEPDLQGERRTYFRLISGRGLYELFRRGDGVWFLSRLND